MDKRHGWTDSSVWKIRINSFISIERHGTEEPKKREENTPKWGKLAKGISHDRDPQQFVLQLEYIMANSPRSTLPHGFWWSLIILIMVPLLQTLVSGLALAGSVIAVSQKQHEETDTLVASQILTNPYTYDFPRLGTPGAKLFPMRRCHGFKLEEATVDEIQERLTNGTFTSVELLACYLDRIHQTQPYLKYVTHGLLCEYGISNRIPVLSCN